jgi:hypothetical protein
MLPLYFINQGQLETLPQAKSSNLEKGKMLAQFRTGIEKCVENMYKLGLTLCPCMVGITTAFKTMM